MPMSVSASQPFEEFVREHEAHIRAVLRARSSSKDCEDDIVQETFCQAFAHLDQLENPGKLRSWLAAIARNRLLEHQRRNTARRRREEHVSEQRPTCLPDKQHEWVWAEVTQLGPDHAALLRCRYLLNMSYDEIARQFEVPVSTIRGRIYAARRALRKRLTDKGLYP